VAFLRRFVKNNLKVVRKDIGILKVIIHEEQYTMKQAVMTRFSIITHIGSDIRVIPLPRGTEMHGQMKQ
jgi:hypothetical protein